MPLSHPTAVSLKDRFGHSRDSRHKLPFEAPFWSPPTATLGSALELGHERENEKGSVMKR
jgi:hypothetical protein